MPGAVVAGYNPDGTPYYGPDALGMFIGKWDNFVSSGNPSGSLAGSGLPGLPAIPAIPATNSSGGMPAMTNQSLLGGLFADLFGVPNYFIGNGATPPANATSGNWLTRFITIVIGIILIIVGLVSLTRGAPIQIIGGRVSE
ncbi:MAG: hypothetical protein KGJ13_05375 [Patescibacteria group bacterium]|nr:hypothetical protein [Patescibacteria group bacterium]